MADGNGHVYNGDELLYVMVRDRMLREKVKGVVGTLMTNYALEKRFEELGVEAVEQCLPSWDLDGMRFVRSKVDLQVMLDESVHTPIDAAKACKIDAADIINIKLMKCGGLYPAEKINAIAEANHVQCMVGCMLETKVAIAAGVSLVAAKQNITEADCDSFMYAVDPEMGMPGGFAVNGGVYTLSDKPGLGIDIDF